MHFLSNPGLRGLWTLFMGVWAIAALRGKKVVKRESISSELSHRIFLIPAIALLFLRFPDTPLAHPLFNTNPATILGGEIVTGLGIAYAFWARFNLGTNWSGSITLKADHQLVRSGPYALSRHPIYTGILLAMLGNAVCMGTIAGVIGFALAVVAFKRKSLVEEHLLRTQFGEEYGRYAQDVRALIPYVW